MAETPQQLLDEIREVLGPLLCGLSDDEPMESLNFAEGQLYEYCKRIWAARGKGHWLTWEDIDVQLEEARNSGDIRIAPAFIDGVQRAYSDGESGRHAPVPYPPLQYDHQRDIWLAGYRSVMEGDDD